MLTHTLTGEWEHIIVSNAKKVIPDSVKDKWTEWRQSMKQAERELTGSEDVSDGVEMAGWGLEEATEQNKKDASKYSLRSHLNLLRPSYGLAEGCENICKSDCGRIARRGFRVESDLWQSHIHF